MKKTIIFLVMVVLAIAMMSTVALAGGWSTIGATHDPDNGEWGDGNVPHYGFATTTNQCRVCHAVHDANSDSYRLLHNNSRTTECDFCHVGAGAVTQLQPFRRGGAYAGADDFDVQGEHTVGSTVVPDANPAILGIAGQIADTGLACSNCHSVHGANVGDMQKWDGTTSVPVKEAILKLDPANNGGNFNNGTAYAGKAGIPAGDLNGGANWTIGAVNATWSGENGTTADKWSLRLSFCSSCHNKNPNVDGSANTADLRVAPNTTQNKTSHVGGAAAVGSLEINGVTETVAGFNKVATQAMSDVGRDYNSWRAEQNTKKNCRSCHQAGDSGATVGVTASAWPHQTKGVKLLQDNLGGDVVDEATALTNATRVINSMDRVCLDCHSSDREGGVAGVGVTF